MTTFRDVWEGLGRYFGVETKVERNYDLKSDIRSLEQEWPEIVKKYGGKENALDLCTWDIFVYGMSGGNWRRVVSMEKARKAGWTKKFDTVKEMEKTLGKMKKDDWIPVFEAKS